MAEQQAGQGKQSMNLDEMDDAVSAVGTELERQLRMYDGIQGMRGMLGPQMQALIQECRGLEARKATLQREVEDLEQQRENLQGAFAEWNIRRQGVDRAAQQAAQPAPAPAPPEPGTLERAQAQRTPGQPGIHPTPDQPTGTEPGTGRLVGESGTQATPSDQGPASPPGTQPAGSAPTEGDRVTRPGPTASARRGQASQSAGSAPAEGDRVTRPGATATSVGAQTATPSRPAEPAKPGEEKK